MIPIITEPWSVLGYVREPDWWPAHRLGHAGPPCVHSADGGLKADEHALTEDSRAAAEALSTSRRRRAG